MSIAIIAWITKILMSVRVSIMQAIDEIATKVVNQFVGLDPAKDPGAVHAGASAPLSDRTAAQQEDLKKVAESSHTPDLSAPGSGLASGVLLARKHEGGNVGGTNGETGADGSGAIGRDGARFRTGAKGPGDAGGTGAPDDKGTGVRSATDSVLGTENVEDKKLARQLARTGRLSDPAHHDQTGVPGTSGVPGKNQDKGKGAGPGKGQNSVATGSPDHKASGAAHRRPTTAGDHPQTGVGSQKASQKPGGNSRTTQSSQSSKAGTTGTTGPRRASSGPAGRPAAQHPQAGVGGRTGQKQAASRHAQGAPGQARPGTPVSAQQSTTTSSGPRPMSSHTTARSVAGGAAAGAAAGAAVSHRPARSNGRTSTGDSTAPTTRPAPSRQSTQSSAPSVPQQSTSANRPVRSTVSSAAPAPAPESRPDTGRPSASSPQAPAPVHEVPVAQQSIRQNPVPTVIQQPAQPAPAPQVQQPVQSVPQSAQTTRSAHPVQSPRVDRGSETDDDEEE
jgi:hypothetical protein